MGQFGNGWIACHCHWLQQTRFRCYEGKTPKGRSCNCTVTPCGVLYKYFSINDFLYCASSFQTTQTSNLYFCFDFIFRLVKQWSLGGYSSAIWLSEVSSKISGTKIFGSYWASSERSLPSSIYP